jgi:hypothetical protein
VEVVGAPTGEASGISGNTKAMVAASTNMDFWRRTMAISGMAKRLQ